MARTKKKYKFKWKNFVRLIVVLLAFSLIILITYTSFNFIKDYNSTEKIVKKIRDEISITSLVDDETTVTIEPEEGISKFSPYWDYIKLGFISVDFDKLKEKNDNTAAWLEIKGTDVSYPILKYSDNTYYKNHSFDKRENQFGWIYLDSSMNIESLPQNTIIYGNKTIMNTLLGDTKRLFTSNWQKNSDNFIIKYSTPDYMCIFQIFSVYKEHALNAINSDMDDTEFANYLSEILNRSTIDFKTSLRSTDKILTIATNSNGTNTFVHAKLIKIKEF